MRLESPPAIVNVGVLRHRHSTNLRCELVYVALYLLVWGEASNLRFTPECICYSYHFMAKEVNHVIDEHIDPDIARPFMPTVSIELGFLKSVIMPIYNTIKVEVDSSRNGKAHHYAWRNYDDINEYFWSRRCLKSLGWPLNFESNFFKTTPKGKRVGKTGFVERRSFWNVYKHFDRLWVMLILFFQAAIIVSWEGTNYPWQALKRRDVQVKMLTVFITWSAMRLLQSVLDAGTQYRFLFNQVFAI
ncbi:Callose synthase [Vigna angularis]|uniref:Callose synthase n=1 Tax=Phaseolus angularis TaxID=3914 RepID=A0A8T0JP41_PHAAN|nr:Callose synthase [Vigna angularis]